LKSEHVYRHIGRARPSELSFLIKNIELNRLSPLGGKTTVPTNINDVAEYTGRLLIDNFAQAAILITRDGNVL